MEMKKMTACSLIMMANVVFVCRWCALVNPNPEFGEMTDARDGQTYQTVTLGDQTWLAQNLNYETDNNVGVMTMTLKIAKLMEGSTTGKQR